MAKRKTEAAKASGAKNVDALTDDEIFEALGLEVEEEKAGGLSHLDARVVAGFEEILRFVDDHKRVPEHGEGKDIFERLYAVRLGRIRGDATFRSLVAGLDKHGLLAGAEDVSIVDPEAMDDDALLEALGIDESSEDSITNLKHVKPRSEVHASEPPEDVATRKECKDFARFKPLFAKVQKDLDTGVREVKEARYRTTQNDIAQGEFFIVFGQMAYIAEVGKKEFRTKDARSDFRLRVIYDNGTESDVLMRSFQRGLSQDPAARRIIDASLGPLFGTIANSDDIEAGTIYVLRSKSRDSYIAARRDLIHKIGVTKNDVELRTAAAEDDPTFLFAPVEVIATYKLYNINRSRLENTLHRIFAPARLTIEIKDRFGKLYTPREWFEVPLHLIDEAVTRIQDGTIARFRYERKSCRFVEAT